MPESSQLHLLCLNPEEELLRTTALRVLPPGYDSAVGQNRFEEFQEVPQIFVGV